MALFCHNCLPWSLPTSNTELQFINIKAQSCRYRGYWGVLKHPRNLEVLLTLFQPEGADYVHHITASTPGFENLTTSLAQ